MVKFLAIALFLCAGTLSVTAFSKSGGGKNTTAAQKTEGPQADEGAPIYAFGFQRPPPTPENALKGTLFDLMSFRPQKKDEDTRKYNEESIKYMKTREDRLISAIKALSFSWNIGSDSWQKKSANPNRKYPQSKTPLFATNIYYHDLKNNGSFFKDEKGVGYPPNCWLCFYEGEFGVPEEGDYRFVGDARTVMLVGVDADEKTGKVSSSVKTVLYAFEPKRGFGDNGIVRHLEGWEPIYAEAETNGSNLFKGTWLHLRPGERYSIKIAIGYCSSDGGNLSPYAYLGVQRRGLEQAHSDTDDNFPLFTLEKVSSKRPKRSLSQLKEGEPKPGQYNSSCVFAPPQK